MTGERDPLLGDRKVSTTEIQGSAHLEYSSVIDPLLTRDGTRSPASDIRLPGPQCLSVPHSVLSTHGRSGPFGYPEVYGLQPNGHCGHCSGLPEHQAHSAYGVFCCACFRWCVYTGPPQTWGDGMRVSRYPSAAGAPSPVGSDLRPMCP
jgi:hypothetical protein